MVPRKRFKRYQVHFIRRFVPRKRFKWNQVSSMMCFVPRKRFRRNKSGNRAEPRWVVLRTFAGFHSPYFGFSSTMPDNFLRPRHPNSTHHVGGTKWPDEVAPTTRMAGRGHASTHFLLPTGSCVDMPRHGSAQSWVIRMPGFIRKQESKRLSSSGRGEPFPTAPRRPGGR